MKKLMLAALLLAGVVSETGSTQAAYYPIPCGPIAPAVPVVTYYGCPAVNYTPGHWSGAGPCCDGLGYGGGYGGGYGRAPIHTSRVYYPGQPIRNVLKVLAP